MFSLDFSEVRSLLTLKIVKYTFGGLKNVGKVIELSLGMFDNKLIRND